jgi:hypothetical protein
VSCEGSQSPPRAVVLIKMTMMMMMIIIINFKTTHPNFPEENDETTTA